MRMVLLMMSHSTFSFAAEHGNLRVNLLHLEIIDYISSNNIAINDKAVTMAKSTGFVDSNEYASPMVATKAVIVPNVTVLYETGHHKIAPPQPE